MFEGLRSGPIRTVLGLLAILAILFSCHWLKAAHDEQSIDLYEFVFSLVFMVFEWGYLGYWFFVGLVAGIAMWGDSMRLPSSILPKRFSSSWSRALSSTLYLWFHKEVGAF